MIRSRAVRVLPALAVVVLAMATTWLSFDNPDIDGTSRGDDYTCLAPWDTVLNDADNFPGGEPPLDGKEIAARCREAGHERFDLALVAGSATAVLAALTTALSWRRPHASVAPSG